MKKFTFVVAVDDYIIDVGDYVDRKEAIEYNIKCFIQGTEEKLVDLSRFKATRLDSMKWKGGVL